MKWKDIENKPSYEFVDGSRLTQVHERTLCLCYEIVYGKNNVLTVSRDHILLCDISRVKVPWLKDYLYDKGIPKSYNEHFYMDGTIKEAEEILEVEPALVSDTKAWLTAEMINLLIEGQGQDVRLVCDDKTSTKIKKVSYVGQKECFCISTNTGHYRVCGVVHHNSVTLRNIIFHALTHSDDIKLAMVDLKISEFARYKKMNNVVGVANTPRETVELLRLAREVMYKRNQQNADRDLTDFVDYKPTKPTGKISVFGQEFDEDTKFDVEIAGEKKQMSLREIFDYIEG